MDRTEVFTQHRPLLFSIAYRMLGTVMDAEDVVQETFLRWQQAADEEVHHPKAYLSTIVTRLCLDQLRSARSQRETYIGPWLPEPLMTTEAPDSAALAESLSLAFLHLLESLSPIERAVFLLREVFDYEYAEIAGIVQKSEANCRQMVSRARAHLGAHRPRFKASREQHLAILQRFAETLLTGDVPGFVSLLTEDVVSYSDGGGKVSAALNPIYGPAKVARFIFGIIQKTPPGFSAQIGEANGQPVIISYNDGAPYSLLALDLAPDGRIRTVHNILNPDKLRSIPRLDL
jgi:RNA polymerase sigma-70 factor (ECF subfamily)